MKDNPEKWRIATMFGRVIAEGDDPGEAMLAGAMVGHDGMTVSVPPGVDAGKLVAEVAADLRAEFGRGSA